MKINKTLFFLMVSASFFGSISKLRADPADGCYPSNPGATGGGGSNTSPTYGGGGGGTATSSPFFYKLNKTQIVSEVNARMATSVLINQNGTGLCGMACIVKALIDGDRTMYQDLVLGIYQDGGATTTHTGYTIRADANIVGSNSLKEVDPNSSSYPKQSGVSMAQADFLLLASLKNTDNGWLNYDPTSWNNQLAGMTLPSGMANLMTNFLGKHNVVNKTNLVTSAGDYTALSNLQTLYKTGNSVFMFINAE